jgi:hypothetical protein
VKKHELRVQFLRSVALLLGCSLPKSNQLPDGVRPDVFGFSLAKGFLFIGESKDSESPGEMPVKARLFSYLKWVAANAADGRGTLLVICFKRAREGRRWLTVVTELAEEVCLEFSESGVHSFDRETAIAWFVVTSHSEMHR